MSKPEETEVRSERGAKGAWESFPGRASSYPKPQCAELMGEKENLSNFKTTKIDLFC